MPRVTVHAAEFTGHRGHHSTIHRSRHRAGRIELPTPHVGTGLHQRHGRLSYFLPAGFFSLAA